MGLATLDLFGPVRLTDAHGHDCTPRLAKARAVLVLLARAPEGRMGRAALRNMIWEDRGAEQQAASLRQALSQIRAALGDARDVLLADAATVSLNFALISVRMPPEERPEEFATDLDLHEPAFTAWLAQQRQPAGPPPAPPAGRLPVVAVTGHGVDLCDLVASTALSRAAKVLPLRVARSEDGFDYFLEILPGPQGELGGLRLTSQDDEVVAVDAFPAEIAPTAAADLAARALLRTPGMGLADVLSFDADRLARAEARLEGQGSATALTLRAFLRNTRIVERIATDPREELAEARALSLDALDQEPDNSFALSVAAHIAIRQARIGSAVDMAKRAVQIAPDSAFAHVALSVVSGATGRARVATSAAATARKLTGATLTPGFRAMAQAAAAAAAGQAEAARDHAFAAADFARGFRPPLRYLCVLQDYLGDPEGAKATLSDLQRIEPGVDAAILRRPDYPLASLRRGGIL